MDFYLFDTPFGTMGLGAEEGALIRLYLPDAPIPRLMPHPTPLLLEGSRQVQDYLAGTRTSFDLPLNPGGTSFQRKVWAALREIPWGQTRTYKDIALTVDCPNGFRAIGQANHRNPLPILIPCHRVVAADGGLGGYSGGLDLKRALLTLEGAHLP